VPQEAGRGRPIGAPCDQQTAQDEEAGDRQDPEIDDATRPPADGIRVTGKDEAVMDDDGGGEGKAQKADAVAAPPEDLLEGRAPRRPGDPNPPLRSRSARRQDRSLTLGPAGRRAPPAV
jgi:hypothetical protein